MADNRNMIARRTTLARATSGIALATGLAIGGSGVAHAQAYEGNPTVVSGGVVINRTTGNDDIQVDTNQAVINWTTNDGALTGAPINFLPNGRTVVYRNNPSVQNQFTVLNRIIPAGTSRAIQFNGTIISQLQTAAGLVPGGNVWFYSPGGIVVNSTAVIDVGGLLLTSSDPVRDGAGNFIDSGGSFTLGAAASASSVIIQPGAQILATPENSYIAMVAPTVLQLGNVSVNGSAMYVGAEAATITFGGNGLFDIQVTTGTDGSGGVAIGHGGVTTGPASSGIGDNHRIYMVAVPKNNAITMAIGAGSQLGFDIAGAVDVDGNSIILSAGYDVFGDFIDTTTPVNPGQAADILVSPADITSAFTAAASRNFLGQSLGGDLNFFSDVEAFGAGSAILDANGATASVNVGGNLSLSSDTFAVVEGADAVGGTVRLAATNGGVISLSGDANLSATGRGGSNFTSGSVGSGTGGLIEILANDGGLVAVGGNLRADVSGIAGPTETDGVGSNFGRGGNIGVYTLGSDGTLLVEGSTDLIAQGFGSDNGGSVTSSGGTGIGGRIDVSAQGSGHLMRFGSAFAADVRGFGGFGGFGINQSSGGIGQGGQIFVNTQGASTLDFLSDLTLSAVGFGGTAGSSAGSAGGAALGGTASLAMEGSGGLINIAANTLVEAGAIGGTGNSAGGLGGNATGGDAIIFQNAAGGNLTIAGVTQVGSFGIGGSGTFGGNGTAGNAQVVAQNAGELNLLSGLTVDGAGFGGSATTPGTGSSGNGTGSALAQIVALSSGIINVVGDVTVSANGTVLGTALTGIDGGNGNGGNASISQGIGGRITINGNANVTATGTGDANQGGGDGIAGNGVGGDARIAVNDFNITITGNATVDASGFGGANLGGIGGGNGIGGVANLGAAVGTLAIGGDGILRASGLGGDAVSFGAGGNGTGGQALVGTVSPTALIQVGGLVDATANGEGGNGSGSTFAGGAGTGGIAQIFAQGGSVTVGGTSFLSASAFGGNGINDASGGSAIGGDAGVQALAGGQVTLNDSAFMAAFAGAGSSAGGSGNTGSATGGDAFIQSESAGSAITINGSFFADATAFGGSSGTGSIGLATGGTAGASTQSGLLQINGDVVLDASATGGDSTLSGTGGNATGGRTFMVVFGTGGGTANATGSMSQRVNGIGGNANVGAGGVGTGGLAEFGTLGIVGTVTVGGDAELLANGFGGTAFVAGNGGDGNGGEARAGVNGATLRGGNITLGAGGFGGNATAGGFGGNGTGGIASLIAGSGPVIGLVDFDSVLIDASGNGGMGGAGTTGPTGGNGGNGGTGTGGSVLLFGTAGNGQLDVLDVQMFANGVGGAGGLGGTGSAGLGGNGGIGGAGRGGVVQFGTQSGTAALTVNVGFADTGNISAVAGAFGGSGGDGGLGSAGIGNGGNGGDAFGGLSLLTVRGSRLTAGDITMAAGGAGGFGGSGGALGGTGGNGTGGGLGFAITDRFQIPANRGLLQAGNILGISTGIGGAGAVSGLGYYSTGNAIELRNADASVGSFVINISGDLPDPVGIVEDFVRITDGIANVGGGFTFATSGSLSTLIDNGALNAGSVGLSAGTFVADTVITAPTNIGAINADAIGLFSNGNLQVTADINAVQDITISVPGSVELFNISSSGAIGISGSSLALGDLNAGDHVNLVSTTDFIGAGNITANSFVAMTAANGLNLVNAAGQGASVNAGDYIDLLVLNGDMEIGALNAGTYIALETQGGNIAIGDTLSGEDTDVESAGSLVFGNAVTGLSFGGSALGNINGGNITASGTALGTSYSVGLQALGGNIVVGNLSGPRNIGLLAAGSATTGSLTSGENVVALATGNILVNGSVTGANGADRFFYVGNAQMASLLGADLDPAPLFAVTPVRIGGSLTVNGPIQVGNLLAGIGTAFTTTGAITANGGRVGITANSISAQAITSTLSTALSATNGNLSVGNIAAGGALTLFTDTGLITAGTLAGSQVGVDGQSAVSIGGVTTTGAAQLRSRAASFASTGAITGGTVNIGGTSIALTDVTSTAGVIAIGATAGNLSFGTLTSSANTQFAVTGSVTGGDITAGSWIGTTVGGDMTLGNLRTTGPGAAPTSGFSVGLGANGAIVTGTIDSFGLLGIGSDDGQGIFGNATSISTGAITAGGSVLLRSNQGLTTGAITSTNEIRVRGGTVTTGALQATNAILAAAMTGSLSTGTVTTGASALLLAAQSVNTGAIGTGTSGTTFIGNSAAIPATGLISTINLANLLATAPAQVGGSVSIGGPVTTGTLLSASNGGFSASGAMTAGTRIDINAGGTAAFGGLATAPTITVASSDIAISQTGGLGGANTGTLTLINSNDGQMVIGGTTSGQGYTLDASEISRLRAGNIVISSPIAGSSGVGIEIRDFTLNGSTAASGVNLNGSEGSLTIQTTSTIRVNGNATFNAMAPTNRVALTAGRVEVNADTGGIFLNGSSPGGVLSITADNIHIAGASVLERLAQDVNFTGRDAALSLPIAISRPDGVIQASRLQFNVGSTLLIQNTGTSLLNAGFFGRVGNVEIAPRSSQGSPGLIDMVIYGQLLDSGDIVRNGTSVRDLIFPTSTGQDGPITITGFTATSSVNGCLLNAASCIGGGGITEQGPTIITHAGPPPPEPAAERKAEREQEEAEAAAEEAARGEAAPRRPIMPPVTIVNTRRLGVEPIIDEPVTSGGNPNLQLDQPLPDTLPDALPDTGGQP
ncbi:beta strand repeat-containing protein [Blastomonas aquatica]|uniref:Filamentous haemagglutinin FhaB/tRNA nuclease CdiA-like TPS domain-containing protein n=1 Tax=Blastomonas aquatica TaxID=1510276 RepID=A0ABQ1JJS0_9SPHN|nr:hypothetical protein [Blastomonas aquatica]GGB70759.1 hypothetical protein GCM10010833_27530 [Blastomonas aquatica]